MNIERETINRKHLIVVDLDGTLLNKDFSTLNQKNKKVLQELQKRGHKICIATGRNYRSALPFYREKKENKSYEEVNLNVGDLVKITAGTFINQEGRIIHLDNKKQKVKIIIEPSGWEITDMPVTICQKILG